MRVILSLILLFLITFFVGNGPSYARCDPGDVCGKCGIFNIACKCTNADCAADSLGFCTLLRKCIKAHADDASVGAEVGADEPEPKLETPSGNVDTGQ